MTSTSLDIHIDLFETQSICYNLNYISHSYWSFLRNNQYAMISTSLHIHIDLFETQSACHNLNFTGHSYWLFWDTINMPWFIAHSYWLFWDTISVLCSHFTAHSYWLFLRHNQCAMISTLLLIHIDLFETQSMCHDLNFNYTANSYWHFWDTINVGYFQWSM